MNKRRVHHLARAAFAMLLLITWVTGASAQVTEIDTCQTLATFGATYKATANIFACGDCLIVAADRITIDLQGFQIVQGIGCSTGAAITDGGVGRKLTTIKNGATFSDDIGSFDYGLDLRASSRTEVLVFDTLSNNIDGIAVGDRALVRDCLSVLNGKNGISGGDFVQVQVTGTFSNGAAGVRVGDRCLVTSNNAESNSGDGILTGASCTVSHNRARANERGIAVEGINSLVTLNTTNDNAGEGLVVQCPGTVTNNNSARNGVKYVFAGPGCFTKNNN